MRLYLRAAATICCASKMLCEHGFSTYTSLPAWHAQIVCSVCQWFGVAMRDGVDGLVFEQLAEVDVGGRLLQPFRLEGLQLGRDVRLVDVAEGHDLDIRHLRPRAATWLLPRPPQPTTAIRTVSFGLARPRVAAPPASTAVLIRKCRRFMCVMSCPSPRGSDSRIGPGKPQPVVKPRHFYRFCSQCRRSHAHWIQPGITIAATCPWA